MPETLDMFDESSVALTLIENARAHARLRAAMEKAPMMRGPRRGARPLPPDILSRPYVVTFRDAEVLYEALLPLIGDDRAHRVIAQVRMQMREAAERDIDPLLGCQVLRAPEGGYVYMPFVAAPSVDEGDPGILTTDVVDIVPEQSVVSASRVN